MTDSIFGDLDIEEISTNPFHVDAGDYTAVVTTAEFRYNDETETNYLRIVYTITDQDSEAYGRTVQERLNYYPAIDKAYLESLEAQERAKVKRNLATLKRRLCGVEGTDKIGLGIPLNEIKNFKPEDLINTEVEMGISNSGDQNQYVNVRWVNKIGNSEPEPEPSSDEEPDY